MDKGTHISGHRIKELIQDFISVSPENTMQDKNDLPAWDDVLVGFASGADPIWQQYKEYVGAFHWAHSVCVTGSLPQKGRPCGCSL